MANKLNKQRYDTTDSEGKVLKRPLTPADALVLLGADQESVKTINKKAGDIPKPVVDAVIGILDYFKADKEPKSMGGRMYNKGSLIG